MRILDKYVLKSFISIFLTCILIMFFLFILIDVISNLDELLENHLPFELLFKYYMSFLPIAFIQVVVFATLISTIYTYSQLNNDNEIIALRASGLNFWQIAKPALAFALVICCLTLLVNERFVPTATLVTDDIRNNNIKINEQEKRADNKKPYIYHMTFFGQKNRLYYIDRFDPEDYNLLGITIISQDSDQKIKEKIVAEEGYWKGLAWEFHNTQITTYDHSKPNIPGDLKFYDKKIMDIKETPEEMIRQNVDSKDMNIKQLKDYISRFRHSGASDTLHSFLVDLYSRYAFPTRSFVILLVCLPFALQTRRRKSISFLTVGLAIAIGSMYYIMDAVGLALGKGGGVPPIVAAWLAPGIYFVTGLFVIKEYFTWK